MKELCLHLLDLAENSAAAGADSIQIQIAEDVQADRLTLSIQDNGRGMDADLVARVIDPFVTSRTTRKVGLGIPLLKAAAEACAGNLEIHSIPGIGTRVDIWFQRSHIDRMPLGDLPGTMLTLLIAHPEINWQFIYRGRDPRGEALEPFEFDDAPIKDSLGEIPLCDPEVLGILRPMLVEGIVNVQTSLAANELARSIDFSRQPGLAQADNLHLTVHGE
jgi:hypothetical protein